MIFTVFTALEKGNKIGFTYRKNTSMYIYVCVCICIYIYIYIHIYIYMFDE